MLQTTMRNHKHSKQNTLFLYRIFQCQSKVHFSSQSLRRKVIQIPLPSGWRRYTYSLLSDKREYNPIDACKIDSAWKYTNISIFLINHDHKNNFIYCFWRIFRMMLLPETCYLYLSMTASTGRFVYALIIYYLSI